MDYTVISGHKVPYIKSKDNEKVKLFSKLSQSKYRKHTSLCLAEGIKLSDEAVSKGFCKYLIVNENMAENSEICRIVSSADGSFEIMAVSEAVFSKISTESAPQGIISVCSFKPEINSDLSSLITKTGKIIALEGIRDPGNLGTIIRSAVAFGFDGVIVGDCADIYSPKTLRATMGALFSIPVYEVSDLVSALDTLKKQGRRVFGAVLNEDSLELGSYTAEVGDITVIGNEGHGLSDAVRSVCTDYVKIPISEKSESLNAAIAASVIMWEYSKIN